MHPVGGRRGVEDVIVTEDFTSGFPRATRWTRLRFLALGIGDLPRFNVVARAVRAVWVAPEYCGRRHENPARVRKRRGLGSPHVDVRFR